MATRRRARVRASLILKIVPSDSSSRASSSARSSFIDICPSNPSKCNFNCLRVSNFSTSAPIVSLENLKLPIPTKLCSTALHSCAARFLSEFEIGPNRIAWKSAFVLSESAPPIPMAATGLSISLLFSFFPQGACPYEMCPEASSHLYTAAPTLPADKVQPTKTSRDHVDQQPNHPHRSKPRFGKSPPAHTTIHLQSSSHVLISKILQRAMTGVRAEWH